MMAYETLRWTGGMDGCLELLDQRKLPHIAEYIRCSSVGQVCEAIRTLAVRGAPAIGVAAAYGMVLALHDAAAKDAATALMAVESAAASLKATRPTAVNLFHAVERMRKCAAAAGQTEGADTDRMREAMLSRAEAIRLEDAGICRRIGLNGERLIPEGGAVLTHCNAGALATAGCGTALAPMFEARKRGRCFSVYVDETRPLFQGARLTAWELMEAGIEATLICDSAAGWLMKQGRIAAVFAGADRIAANGDAANKVGTYSLSILARASGIPFYIAAPSTTFDMAAATGSDIPIEQRDEAEVTSLANIRIAPKGVKVYNPAFDVTDAANITAIITETGVIERPDIARIAAHFGH
ncbi:MAG TPA: S-methyl-5-thioribose-1-phosphate isomerase [Sedimentisphaerales bacterium]|nr:S-methyl-5-thioribose-1-phosphate isomerase [Sedimentisphaerales bacterium]